MKYKKLKLQIPSIDWLGQKPHRSEYLVGPAASSSLIRPGSLTTLMLDQTANIVFPSMRTSRWRLKGSLIRQPTSQAFHAVDHQVDLPNPHGFDTPLMGEGSFVYGHSWHLLFAREWHSTTCTAVLKEEQSGFNLRWQWIVHDFAHLYILSQLLSHWSRETVTPGRLKIIYQQQKFIYIKYKCKYSNV